MEKHKKLLIILLLIGIVAVDGIIAYFGFAQRQKIAPRAAGENKIICEPVGGMSKKYNSTGIKVTNTKTTAVNIWVQQNVCDYEGFAPAQGYECNTFLNRNNYTLAPGETRTFGDTIPACKIGQIDVNGLTPADGGCYTPDGSLWDGGLGYAIGYTPSTNCQATPTASPSASLTPSPTASPSATLTPNPTVTATPTPTNTPTPTLTPTPRPTNTPTPTITLTPTPLPPGAPTLTPTPTSRPTNTPTPAVIAQAPTNTPTPIPPTPTPTKGPTATPVVVVITATPTPTSIIITATPTPTEEPVLAEAPTPTKKPKVTEVPKAGNISGLLLALAPLALLILGLAL